MSRIRRSGGLRGSPGDGHLIRRPIGAATRMGRRCAARHRRRPDRRCPGRSGANALRSERGRHSLGRRCAWPDQVMPAAGRSGRWPLRRRPAARVGPSDSTAPRCSSTAPPTTGPAHLRIQRGGARWLRRSSRPRAWALRRSRSRRDDGPDARAIRAVSRAEVPGGSGSSESAGRRPATRGLTSSERITHQRGVVRASSFAIQSIGGRDGGCDAKDRQDCGGGRGLERLARPDRGIGPALRRLARRRAVRRMGRRDCVRRRTPVGRSGAGACLAEAEQYAWPYRAVGGCGRKIAHSIRGFSSAVQLWSGPACSAVRWPFM